MKKRFLLKTAPLSILLIFLSINTILSQTKHWIGVSNSIGQVLKTTKDNRLSLADLPKGVYIVSVKTDKAFMSEKVFNF